MGAPVVRGDPEVAGARATEAARFDPRDEASLDAAAGAAAAFARTGPAEADHLAALRGAAACAALLRGTGSYVGAARRAGEPVTEAFLRTWVRVHDLPLPVRRHVAAGDLSPAAAKHVARVSGTARYLLAWATLDHDLPVETVRQVADAVTAGAPVERALRERGATPGELSVTLPPDAYVALRRHAGRTDRRPGEVVAAALDEWLEDR